MNTQSPSNSDKPGFQVSWLIGALIALIPVAIALYFLFAWEPEQNADADMPAPAVETVLEEPFEPVTSPPVETEPVAEIETVPEPPPLPPLDNSDTEVAESIAELNPGQTWQNWFNTDELVRKFVVVTDNMASQQVARKYIPLPKPSTPFKVKKVGNTEFIDPQSYRRYDAYVQQIASTDTSNMTSLYRRYSPLFEQAYTELGYADGNFDKTLLQAIDAILATPIVEGDIELDRGTVLYKFADPKLERLSALQKQILRMGPDNTRILFRKLRELRSSLVAGGND